MLFPDRVPARGWWCYDEGGAAAGDMCSLVVCALAQTHTDAITFLHTQDEIAQQDVTTWPELLQVDVPAARQCRLVSSTFSPDPADVAAATAASMTMEDAPLGCTHSHYMQLENTYQGFWVASRHQMLTYMKSR